MLSVGLCHGDELFLKNGDHLTGKIVNLIDGKMSFKSDAAGEVTVNISDIQTLSSDEPVTVSLRESTGFRQKVISGQPGQFAVQGSEAL